MPPAARAIKNVAVKRATTGREPQSRNGNRRTRPTIDEITRAERSGYSSIKRSRGYRRQLQDSQEFYAAEADAQANERGVVRRGITATRALARETNKLRSLPKQTVRKNTKTMRRLMRTIGTILWPGVIAWGFILGFCLIGLFGLSSAFIGEGIFDWIPVFGDDLAEIAGKPGQWIFSAGWILSAIVSFLATGICGVWLAINRIRWWSRGLLLFTFIVCLSLSLAPLVNFIPWYFVFLGVVALTYR